ncbi:RagB/SusD family nutrient uptake outer membrane protein [Flavobacterium sp.]
MKKFKQIFISSIFVLFLSSSCEDAYNIVQDGEINEESLTTLSDLQSYLNAGVYGSLSISNEIAFSAIFTDETSIGRGNGGQGTDLHRFFLNSDDGYAFGIWYGSYQTINRVNRTLRIANRIGAPVYDPNDQQYPAKLAQYNSILGEAKALRAFSYMRLLTYFSPNMKDNNATGVMFIGDAVPAASDNYPRVANGIIYSAIEDDLNFAMANISTTADYKHVTKNMINSLRARMYLYRGNFLMAKQYAETVIATSGLSLTLANPVPNNAPVNGAAGAGAWNAAFYSANSTNPYRKMWNDSAQGEILFAFDRPASGVWENVAANFTTNTTSASGSPLHELSRNLFNKLTATSGDVRRYTNVDPTSQINPNYADPGVDYIATDVLVIDKYPGKSGFPLRNDIKVFRLSEMYFILAECYANDGMLNGATNSVAQILKKIRDARNFLGAQPLPNYTDVTEAYADILLERRLELCFEGHRYIDVKRIGTLAGKQIERDATDDEIAGPLTLPNDDYRYTMPIPRSEFNGNSSMTQNTGY